MLYVMQDVWCKMCDVPDLIFCKILTLWVKGGKKYPIGVISDLLSDIPKVIPGGNHIYTISCKASILGGYIKRIKLLQKKIKESRQWSLDFAMYFFLAKSYKILNA